MAKVQVIDMVAAAIRTKSRSLTGNHLQECSHVHFFYAMVLNLSMFKTCYVNAYEGHSQ